MEYTVMQRIGKQILGWLCVVATPFLGRYIIRYELADVIDAGNFWVRLLCDVIVTAIFWTFILAATRPRIHVKGEEITVYPLWKTAKRLSMSDITRRYKEIGDDNSNQAFGESAQRIGAKPVNITYYVGEKKLLTIDTTMTNAERFDDEVGRILARRENVFMSR